METLSLEQQFGKDREAEFRRQNPSTFLGEYRYIADASAYILVDDVSSTLRQQRLLSSISQYSGPNVEMQSMESQVRSMAPMLEQTLSQYPDEQVALIFPGGGGKRFQQYLPTEITARYRSIPLDISRRTNPQTGEKKSYMSEEEQYRLRQNLDDITGAVIVCDDAIKGGGTLRLIRKTAQVPTASCWPRLISSLLFLQMLV